MKKYTNLEYEMLQYLMEMRQGLGLMYSEEPLSLRRFTELLSGSGFLFRHGVMSRRLGYGEQQAERNLEDSIKKIANLGNLGICPTANERREILSLSSGVVTSADKFEFVDTKITVASAVQEIVGNVVYVDFNPLQSGGEIGLKAG